MSSSTVMAVAAFALFELITLGALFGVHQNVQSELDERSRRLDVSIACDSLSDSLVLLEYSIGSDSTYYADKRAESTAKCDRAISDLQKKLSADVVERASFERLSALVRRYQLAVSEACSEPKVPLAETTKAGFRFKVSHSPIPSLKAELTSELANFKSVFEQKLVVTQCASHCHVALLDIVVISLLVHISIAGFLVLGLHNFYFRDFDEGGAVGGIKPAALGWIRITVGIPFRQFALMVVPVVLELFAVMSLMSLQVEARKESAELYRAKEIVIQANLISKSFYDAGIAIGGYSITLSKRYEARFDDIVSSVPSRTDHLAQLVDGSQKKLQSVARIKKIVDKGIKLLGEAKHAIDDPTYFWQFRARHMYKDIRLVADQLQDELKVLTADDRAILDADPATQHKMRTLFSQCFQFDLLLHLGVLASCLLLLFKRAVLPVVSKGVR